MVDGFEWDEGNWPKCTKHGLTKAAIESVFSGEVFVFDERHVFVVFTLRVRGKQTFIRPITARYMHKKEIEHYDRQK